MIVIGVVLWLLGFLTGLGILETLGIVLVAVGLILLLVGAIGQPIAGRRYWW